MTTDSRSRTTDPTAVALAVDPGNKQRDLHGNTFDLCGKRTPVISSVCQANDYSRSSEALVMNLDPGCRKGYSKQRDPYLWFKPAVGEVVTKIPGSSRIEAYYSVDALDLLPRESRGCWKQHSPGTLPESMVERPKYQTPRAILQRLDPTCIRPTEVGPSGSGGRQDKSSLDPTGQPDAKGTVTPARVSEARRQSPVQRSGPDPDDMVTGERSLDPDPGDGQLKVDDYQIPDPATGNSLALLNSTAELDMSSETQDPERARDPAVGEYTIPAVPASSGNPSETGGGPANPTAVGGKKTPDPADLQELVDGQSKQVVDSQRERDQIPDPTDSLDPGPDDSTTDEQVCYHESGDLHAGDVAPQMAVLSEVTPTTEEVTIEDIQVGDPDINTPEEIERLRRRIWRRRHLLIGKGNALPPAARGAVCDIDVGNAKPIAQRVRKVAPQFREKLSDLIKGLLGAKIISVSTSPWSSPTVVIIKMNGVDIRLCIDYRLVNSLARLMIYPMPLINDLLDDLDKVLWYCSLDMASGFWVVTMTDRARAISAFITAFGLFEWNRMSFGLKNAPQIYQRMLDNALVEDLLDACDRWNLTIGVVKRFWGKSKVGYLGHQVSSSGLEANPKDLAVLTDLPFPQSLRSMQSFIGSLNYYSRFIENYAIYAAVLYELREVDFAAMSKTENQTQIQARVVRSTPDPDDPAPEQVDPRFNNLDPSPNGSIGVDPRWIRAHLAFGILKGRIADTPILRHFDPDKLPVIVVYASTWAISAALMQEHAGDNHPVIFTSRALKSNELNYGVVEKEVLALLRILDLGYNMLVGRQILVLTRHSTLARLFRSTGLQGRLGQWAALLSPWTLEIVKCKKGEDEILGVIAASITPRAEVDLALKALDRLRIGPDHDLVHVKRDWNGSADRLASAALQRQAGIMMEDEADLLDLVTLNRLDEILRPEIIQEGYVARVVPVAIGSQAGSRLGGSGPSGSRPGGPGSGGFRSAPEVLGEEIVRDLRISRIRQAQDEEVWISGLKPYLAGRIQQLTQDEAISNSKVSMDYDVDLNGLLYYCPPTKHIDSDRDRPMKLVVPETLQQDVLHHYHVSLEGVTKGSTGESPGNIQATYPFQVIAMDHIPSLPKSFKGNTELLIWVDLFSGYVISKASGSRTAQTIAESYEECVFRRFGASELI
ncbi:unnamed protein product [Phytophthora fragariaefolia]|uniref:Unnamed protein product n=1 Tax=Phytophthora fragariaefolia TaxID=1490495 RepID=A0A9W7D9V0_9STRA|nr:unnamed protein product [Phytophthora fragariaefolia]